MGADGGEPCADWTTSALQLADAEAIRVANDAMRSLGYVPCDKVTVGCPECSAPCPLTEDVWYDGGEIEVECGCMHVFYVTTETQLFVSVSV